MFFPGNDMQSDVCQVVVVVTMVIVDDVNLRFYVLQVLCDHDVTLMCFQIDISCKCTFTYNSYNCYKRKRYQLA